MATTQPVLPSRGLLSLVFFPIVVGWRLATFVIRFAGILLTLVIGLLMMMVGVLLCSTFFGFFIGLPLAVFGFLLMVRALY